MDVLQYLWPLRGPISGLHRPFKFTVTAHRPEFLKKLCAAMSSWRCSLALVGIFRAVPSPLRPLGGADGADLGGFPRAVQNPGPAAPPRARPRCADGGAPAPSGGGAAPCTALRRSLRLRSWKNPQLEKPTSAGEAASASSGVRGAV